jgi:putative transposase
VYNWALNLRKEAWFKEKKRIGYVDTSRELTKLKKQPDTIWLNASSAVAEQQSLMHLQEAFDRFWRKTTRYPKFKAKHQGNESASFASSAFDWKPVDRVLTLTKIGSIKIRWDKRKFQDRPTTVTISKNPANHYFVSFTIDELLPQQPKPKNKAVGIDLGLTSFATLSTGQKFQAPKPLKAKQAQLKRAQRKLSRRQKASKNRAKARVKAARIYEKIGNIRKDFTHKLSTKLVRENQTICLEDLNVRGMVQNHKLAKSISDVAWSEFVRQLQYKADWYGRTVVQIDRFYPSTKRCYDCGYVIPHLELSDRKWTCPQCNIVHDRDINAAQNILAAGLAVTVCGDGIRPPKKRRKMHPKVAPSVKQKSRC